MLTILEEGVNGWILTIYGEDGRQLFIYERLVDAQNHRAKVENDYEYGKLEGVTKYASAM